MAPATSACYIEAELATAHLTDVDFLPWPFFGLSAGAGVARDWSSLAGHWGPQGTIAVVVFTFIVPFYRIDKIDGDVRQLIGVMIKVPCYGWPAHR